MNRKIVLFGLAFIPTSLAFAQDPQFSQYYASPLYLNPGFTGITPQQRLTSNYRIQWPNLPQAYVTYGPSGMIFLLMN
ncbi:MAG: type IX secretion system membrane protein PorP/SprF [Cytophagales bacterium]|nr:type IX secretion system membrane protein PorP/SprF [Cytophagales bacterium]